MEARVACIVSSGILEAGRPFGSGCPACISHTAKPCRISKMPTARSRTNTREESHRAPGFGKPPALDESQRRLEASLSDLRASEQRYRILAENASDIIWTFDLETMRFTYYSPSVTKVMDYTLEEALSLSLAELLLPEDLKTVMGELDRELDRDGGEGVDPRRSRTFEFRLRCRDGSYI